MRPVRWDTSLLALIPVNVATSTVVIKKIMVQVEARRQSQMNHVIVDALLVIERDRVTVLKWRIRWREES